MVDAARDGADDATLLRRAGHGDADALGALYERHHGHVRALCLRMVGDPDVADDLAQECFLRVRRYGAGFDGRSSVPTWLYRLVRNRCLDHRAGARRHDAGAKRWGRELRAVGSDTAAPPALPDEAREERAERVRRALDALSPEMREVLVLSRYEGLRYTEIAELCDLSLSNVKVRAHRALKQLRRILSEREDDHAV